MTFARAGIEPASRAYGAPRKTIPIPPAPGNLRNSIIVYKLDNVKVLLASQLKAMYINVASRRSSVAERGTHKP